MTDNHQIKSSIKFRQADDVTIVFVIDSDNADTQNIVPLASTQKSPHMTIGPLIDRVRCVKSFYAVTIDGDPDIWKISNDHLTISYRSGDKICFTTKYKEFKRYFKIVCAHELSNLSIPLTDKDLLDDLDFMKSEIVTCQINMNVLKQKGDMDKFTFYDNMINNQQHVMFQVPTAEQYALYLDKIGKLLDNNDENITNKEKQIMNDVMSVSKEVW